MDVIHSRLARWKQRLIDQTLKNPLLNFRKTKLTTISVVDEKPAEVFRVLLIEEPPVSMYFISSDQPILFENTNSNEYSTANSSSHDRSSLEQRHTNRGLQTDLAKENLDLNLLRIYQKSTAMYEEQGFSSLCVSLGMLEWSEENESNIKLKAPLVLLPVQLSRETAGSKFTVRATNDDPVFNPAIVEKLRASYRITLPQLPDSYEEFDLNQIFTEVRKSVAEKGDWHVTEEIYLGFFAFHKFVMYKDLESSEDVYLKHEVIQALCTVTNVLPVDSDNSESAPLDTIVKPENTFQVVDADSSQIEAILAVKHGSHLVIEGPPGTGKSQTITNLIAESLASGKSVLFVSEKRAALEVVYNRLGSAGLTDFCLELHSNKTSKKTVYEELRRVLDSTRPPDHKEDSALIRLTALRDSLNEYSQALHMPFGTLGVAPYWAVGEIARLDKAPIINADIEGLEAIDHGMFEERCRELTACSELLSRVGDTSKHPWNGSELMEINAKEEDHLREQIQRLEVIMQKLRSECDQLAELIGASKTNTFGQTEILCEIATSLANSPGTTENLLMNERWNSIAPDIAELLEKGQRYSEAINRVSAWFQEELLEEDFEDMLNQYKHHTKHWYRCSNPDFWKRRAYFHKFFRQAYRAGSNTELISNLHMALQCRYDMLYVREHNPQGTELFGDKWRGLNSDWKALKSFAQWIVSVRHFIVEQALTSRGVALAASGGVTNNVVAAKVQTIRSLIDETLNTLEQVCVIGGFDQSQYLNARVEVDYIMRWAYRLVENLHLLYEWCELNKTKKGCIEQSSTRHLFLQFFQQDEQHNLLSDSFRKCFLRRWLDVVYRERPVLAKFHTLRQEQSIKEFRELDLRSLELARRRLKHNLFRMRDELLKSTALEAQLMILQRQIRARSKVPLRRLFKEIPSVLKAVKPCFMMSPLSAVQFIQSTNETPYFDLIIFDEASQITTEDAVGTIVRGKQLIVVGDPKQLPPTDFFMAQLDEDLPDTNATSDKEYDELQITDLESVLDECLANNFPSRRLKWHYRSKHESLITFSNRNFYENELLTFPSPDTGVGERGVIFNYTDGVYEGNGINAIEAQAVVDAICRHIKESPHLSLGVGTFNIKQQTLIQDELDRRRRNDPSIEFFFAKKGETEFFVKNLENIQGDDRDVIFLSMTYGRGREGQLSHNFGPINRPNGWRRLNVILTRAKLKMEVFSSMRAEDIDPSRCASSGARYLQEFLRFAETGIASSIHVDAGAKIESPFEQAVYRELTQIGIRLIPQVGQAGYRIDFGVIDNVSPGRFLIGIECDGATYHSAATARDRDRLRQQVLEGLGWKLIRIWSTDWYHDKNSQIKKVSDYIEEQKPYVLSGQLESVCAGENNGDGNPTTQDLHIRNDGNGDYKSEIRSS